MPNRKLLFCRIAIIVLSIWLITGCSTYESITGYFNTYYNAKKGFDDAIDESEKSPLKDRDTNYFAAYSISPGTHDKFDKVIEKCTKLIQSYPRSAWIENTLFIMGRSYYYQGETESALRKFKELQENFPNSKLNVETKLWQAKTLYISHKQDEVLQNINDLTNKAEASGNNDVFIESLMLEGQIHFERGEYSTAALAYKRASKISGSDKLLSVVFFQLGQSYERSDELDKAAEAYGNVKKFTADFSKEFEARLRQGIMLSRAGKYNTAFKLFDGLKEEKLKTEEFALVELEIANTYTVTGDTTNAFDLYRLIDTTYRRTDAAAKGYFQRGKLYENSYFDLKSARTYYDKAKVEYPSSEITLLASRKSGDLNNYFKHYENLALYDSLLQKALYPDSLQSKRDSIKKISDTLKTKYDSLTHSPNPSEKVLIDKRVTDIQKNIDSGLVKNENKLPIVDSSLNKTTQNKVDVKSIQHNEREVSNSSPKEKTYTVGTWAKDRDCLWNIAKKKEIYDNAWMWTKIWQRNRDKIKDPDIIKPKWVLKISDIIETTKSANTSANITTVHHPQKAVSPEITQGKKKDNASQSSDSVKSSKFLPPDQAEGIVEPFLEKDSAAIDSHITRNHIVSDSSLKAIIPPQNIPDAIAKKMRDEDAYPSHKKDTAKATRVVSPVVPVKLSPDSLRALKARTEFELAGLLFLEMNLPDSALTWYQHLVSNYPLSPYIPRTLYAMAEIYRSKNDSLMVDSLYQVLLHDYDTTQYARQVMKILGMESSNSNIDSAETVFREAEKLFQNKKFQDALQHYNEVVKFYPSSPFAPKALYTMGWIHETILIENDTAASLYKRLIKDYPTSLYAENVKPKIAVKENPKTLQQYIKINEIQPLAKTADNAARSNGKKSKERGKENLKEPDSGENQDINVDEDQQDQQDEEEPTDDESDDSGGD